LAALEQLPRRLGLVFGHLDLNSTHRQAITTDGQGGIFVLDNDQKFRSFQAGSDQLRLRRIEGSINANQFHIVTIALKARKFKQGNPRRAPRAQRTFVEDAALGANVKISMLPIENWPLKICHWSSPEAAPTAFALAVAIDFPKMRQSESHIGSI
jgi:hypothetical protein